tara:strand:- start:245 stop:625 length:381 start_codon:yes stop_codon:yes gene_type:complete
MNAPEDRKYSKDHEWIVLDSDGTARIGVSDFAQEQLGDVVFIELPDVGANFSQFDKMGEVESVKAVSDLYVPASGEITEVNQQVISNPELLNEDPYNQGWLVKVRLNNPEELDSLLDSKSYINIIS